MVGSKCKVRPSASSCAACNEYAMSTGDVPDCNKCVLNNQLYTVVGYSSSIFGGTAFVERNGNVTQVLISHITLMKGDE